MSARRNDPVNAAASRAPRAAVPRVLSLRHVGPILRLAEEGTISRAAKVLRRSQAAVSKSLSQAEHSLGATLFLRRRAGSILTEEGRAVILRFRTIELLLGSVAKEYARVFGGTMPGKGAALKIVAATKRIRQLVALYESQSVDDAGRQLGISPSAIYKSVRLLEGQLGHPLFSRGSSDRVVAAELGTILLPTLKLALAEIDHAVEDVAALQGRTQGRVAIGCLPSMAPHVVPAATVRLLRDHPEVDVALYEGPYDELLAALRCGDIDVVVGGIAAATAFPGVRTHLLALDQVCIVARAGHPLAVRKQLSAADFKGYRWILPMRGSIARPIFNELIVRAGIELKAPAIENSSIVALNELLTGSDLLTVGTALQIQPDQERGTLVRIPFDLSTDPWPIGLILRGSTQPGVALHLFIESLVPVVRELVMKVFGKEMSQRRSAKRRM